MTGPLTRATSISQADGFVVYSQSNQGFYYVPYDVVFLAFAQGTSISAESYVTQYSSPSTTGFSVSISPASYLNVHLILTPTAGFANGTIILPPASGCRDGQSILVNCTQQVTNLTINGNGASAVTGEPSTLGADDFFTLAFDLPSLTWYRVG